jgi:excisionase family DNA binding protein
MVPYQGSAWRLVVRELSNERGWCDMSEGIQFDGKPYISAQDAAREIGLSGDYVARLARTGRLPAHRVAGGTWFVDHEAANGYRTKDFRSRSA